MDNPAFWLAALFFVVGGLVLLGMVPVLAFVWMVVVGILLAIF